MGRWGSETLPGPSSGESGSLLGGRVDEGLYPSELGRPTVGGRDRWVPSFPGHSHLSVRMSSEGDVRIHPDEDLPELGECYPFVKVSKKPRNTQTSVRQKTKHREVSAHENFSIP